MESFWADNSNQRWENATSHPSGQQRETPSPYLDVFVKDPFLIAWQNKNMHASAWTHTQARQPCTGNEGRGEQVEEGGRLYLFVEKSLCKQRHLLLVLSQEGQGALVGTANESSDLLINHLCRLVAEGLVKLVLLGREGHQAHLLIHAIHSHLAVGHLGDALQIILCTCSSHWLPVSLFQKLLCAAPTWRSGACKPFELEGTCPHTIQSGYFLRAAMPAISICMLQLRWQEKAEPKHGPMLPCGFGFASNKWSSQPTRLANQTGQVSTQCCKQSWWTVENCKWAVFQPTLPAESQMLSPRAAIEKLKLHWLVNERHQHLYAVP